MMKQIAYISLLIFSFTLVGQAQRNTIEGRVVGPNGEGIQDARVFLKNGNLSDIAQDLTDSQGNYRFTSLSDGIYYIEALPVGAVTRKRHCGSNSFLCREDREDLLRHIVSTYNSTHSVR